MQDPMTLTAPASAEAVAWTLRFHMSDPAPHMREKYPDGYGALNHMTTFGSEAEANAYADRCATNTAPGIRDALVRPLVVPLYTTPPAGGLGDAVPYDKARDLIHDAYQSGRAGTGYTAQVTALQAACLASPSPGGEACPHEAWEETGGARHCADCREYLGSVAAPATPAAGSDADAGYAFCNTHGMHHAKELRDPDCEFSDEATPPPPEPATGKGEAGEIRRLIESARNQIEAHRNGLGYQWEDWAAEIVRDLNAALAALHPAPASGAPVAEQARGDAVAEVVVSPSGVDLVWQSGERKRSFRDKPYGRYPLAQPAGVAVTEGTALVCGKCRQDLFVDSSGQLRCGRCQRTFAALAPQRKDGGE